MTRLEIPMFGLPNENMYDKGLYECSYGGVTFFVENGEEWGHPGEYLVFVQPGKRTYFYDNTLLVYTHIHNAIEELKNAEHREADTGTGQDVERHA